MWRRWAIVLGCGGGGLAVMLGLALMEPAQVARAAGNSYYVSPSGEDGNAGSLDAPFRTVQHCADVAQPGDRCILRAGTYRETVTVPRSGVAGSPITFTVYAGESAAISGADLITSTWVVSSGAIYKTSMTWSAKNMAGDPNTGALAVDNQVWVDGQPLPEARWPNLPVTKTTFFTRDDLAQTDGAYTTTVSTGVITDAALSAFGNNFWQNAKINIAPGAMWVNVTCSVTGSTTSTLNVSCPGGRFNEGTYALTQQNHYFLWSTLAALDVAGEWFRSGTPSLGTLYLWLPDGTDPTTHTVEAKRRLWAFDLSGQGYIHITGLTLFGASIRTDAATHHTLLQEVALRYPWHFQEYASGTQSMHYKGAFTLQGNDNVIRDSTLSDSAADLLYIDGQNNQIVNNVIENIGYMGVGLAIAGNHSPTVTTTHVLSQNTIFNAGGHAVYMAPYLDIFYNDVYSSHALITDMGTLYSWGTSGREAEIAYNTVHDNWAVRNDSGPVFFGGSAIYFDFASSDYVVHHNVTWNTTRAGLLAFAYDHDPVAMTANPGITDMNLLLYNNTVDGTLYLDVQPGTHMTGTETINNLIRDLHQTLPPFYAGTYTRTLAFGATDPGFADWANRDYRLTGGNAVDHGMALPPYTDGYVGAAPDAGAFEGMSQTWVAGALLRESDLSALMVTCSGSGSATCTVSGLSRGRKAPYGFQIRIGAAAGGGSCRNTTDYSTHLTTAACSGIPATGEASGQSIAVSLDGATWTQLGVSVYLPLIKR